MKDFFLYMAANSNPASLLNVFLNVIQIVVTMWAVWIILKYKQKIHMLTTEGTRWLVSEAVKVNNEEHMTRLYQRVDALATAIGKEFLCNPEHLIPHRGANTED